MSIWLNELDQDQQTCNSGQFCCLQVRLYRNFIDAIFCTQKLNLWHLLYRNFIDGIFLRFWSQSESDCTEALFVASFSVWSQSWCRTISINSVPAFEGSSKADCINFGNMFRPFHKGKSYPDRCCLIGLIFSSYNIIVQEDLVHMDFRRAISSQNFGRKVLVNCKTKRS